jgi:hypothetical protein
MGLDSWLGIAGRAFRCRTVPSKGSLQLDRGLRNSETPRAIGRFINWKAAVVGLDGSADSSFRASRTAFSQPVDLRLSDSQIGAKLCPVRFITWKAFCDLANRSDAGRARSRVVDTIEQERRIICTPGRGRNRMIILDALRTLNIHSW